MNSTTGFLTAALFLSHAGAFSFSKYDLGGKGWWGGGGGGVAEGPRQM